jgi:hypothetical protein
MTTNRTPLSANDLYRQYRNEGRDHSHAIGQVAHAFGQGQNSDEERVHFEESLRDVAAEFDSHTSTERT